MRLVQLTDVPQRIKLPAHWVFKPEDAFSPLWKATLGDVDESVMRAMAMAWPKLGRQQVRAKLATTLATDGPDAVVRLSRAHRDRLAAKWEGMPRLPADRLAVLLAEADETGAQLSTSLGRLHHGLAGGGYGVQMLQQLASQLDVADEAAASSKRQDKEAGLRGRRHEEDVLEWVGQQWPAPVYRVLGPCSLVSPARELGGDVRGVKQEFDAVVLAQRAAPRKPSQTAPLVEGLPQRRYSGGGGGGDGGSVGCLQSNSITDYPNAWRGAASGSDHGASFATSAEGLAAVISEQGMLAATNDHGVRAPPGAETVVTVVEAKAGRRLFEDLPKLLAARRLFEGTRAPLEEFAGRCSGVGGEHGRPAMASGCDSQGEDVNRPTAHTKRRGSGSEAGSRGLCAPPSLQLRVGGAGGRRVHVHPSEPVHLIYVFGAAAPSLAEIARASALAAEAALMLKRQLAMAATELAAPGAGGSARGGHSTGESGGAEDVLTAPLGPEAAARAWAEGASAVGFSCEATGCYTECPLQALPLHAPSVDAAPLCSTPLDARSLHAPSPVARPLDAPSPDAPCLDKLTLAATPLAAAPLAAASPHADPRDERHVWGARVVAGGLRVEFRGAVQAASQSSVDAFVQTLQALVHGGRASFWAQGPLGGEEVD
jgi:hypothetical protein